MFDLSCTRSTAHQEVSPSHWQRSLSKITFPLTLLQPLLLASLLPGWPEEGWRLHLSFHFHLGPVPAAPHHQFLPGLY